MKLRVERVESMWGAEFITFENAGQADFAALVLEAVSAPLNHAGWRDQVVVTEGYSWREALKPWLS